MPRLAILTTYPIVDAKHGGQIRTRNLVRQFEDHGFDVLHLAVCDEGNYELGPRDIIFPAQSEFRLYKGQSLHLMSDFQTSIFVKYPEIMKKIQENLGERLDFMLVEQPFLWPVADYWRKNVDESTILIYGSQNIEFDLKEGILRSYGINVEAGVHRDALLDLKRLEREAALSADLVASVSAKEAEIHRSWGCRNVVVAKNGTEIRDVRQDRKEFWQRRLPSQFLVFVGSAHPPNFMCFFEIMGGSLASIPPDARLVVVGSVSPHIERVVRAGMFSQINAERLQVTNMVSDEDLDAIKSLATGFFLPIPYGGGTNLKTAEALASGKPVVGTAEAFRGFEDYLDNPLVSVCHTPSEIHTAIRQAFRIPHSSKGADVKSEQLSWKHALHPLVAAASVLRT